MSQTDGGSAVVYLKEFDSSIMIDKDDYKSLIVAWTQGLSFYNAKDIYGDPLTIKLGAVIAVGLATPEGIRLYRADQEEAKLRD